MSLLSRPRTLSDLPDEVLDKVFSLLPTDFLIENYKAFPSKFVISNLFRWAFFYNGFQLSDKYVAKIGSDFTVPFYVVTPLGPTSVVFDIRDPNFSYEKLKRFKGLIRCIDTNLRDLKPGSRKLAEFQAFMKLLTGLKYLNADIEVSNTLSKPEQLRIATITPSALNFETSKLRSLSLSSMDTYTFELSTKQYPELRKLHLTNIALKAHGKAPMLKHLNLSHSKVDLMTIQRLGHLKDLYLLGSENHSMSVPSELGTFATVRYLYLGLPTDASKLLRLFPNCEALELLGSEIKLPETLSLPKLKKVKIFFGDPLDLRYFNCPALETVTFEYCRFPFEQVLESLKHIKSLQIFRSELSFMISLQSLQYLELKENSITRLANLSFPNLDQLVLEENPLEEISNVYLPALTSLDVSKCRLKDLGFIACAPNLKYLYASNNEFKSTDSLKGHQKLELVDLTENIGLKRLKLEDIPNLSTFHLSDSVNWRSDLYTLSHYLNSPEYTNVKIDLLEGLPNLKELSLFFCLGRDLTPFSKCVGLKSLVVTNSDFESMKGLESLVNLEILDLSGCEIDRILDLKSQNLKVLALNKTCLRELKNLPICEALEELYVNETELTRLDGSELRRSFPNLTTLEAQKCEISAIVHMSWLKLKVISLDGNKITSVEGIHDLPDLERLWLENNSIKEISPDFKNLPLLYHLSLDHNMLSDLKPLQNVKLDQGACITAIGNKLKQESRNGFPHHYQLTLLYEDMDDDDDEYSDEW